MFATDSSKFIQSIQSPINSHQVGQIILIDTLQVWYLSSLLLTICKSAIWKFGTVYCSPWMTKLPSPGCVPSTWVSPWCPWKIIKFQACLQDLRKSENVTQICNTTTTTTKQLTSPEIDRDLNARIYTFYIGGWSPTGNLCRFVRACVRAVWLSHMVKRRDALCLFPFCAGAFPFSLVRVECVLVSSSEFRWIRVSTSEFKWVQVNPSELKWVIARSSESKWIQASSSEPKWVH